MSSFGSASFKVKVDDKAFPAVTLGEDGIPRYSATVFVDSRSDAVYLLNKVAIVTPKRAVGSKAVSLHIDAGSTGTLSVPSDAGELLAYTAALISCTPRGNAVYANAYWIDCEWIISSDITP